LVPDPAPEIHDHLTGHDHTHRPAQLAPPREVVDERVAHRLEASSDYPANLLVTRLRPVSHSHPDCHRNLRRIRSCPSGPPSASLSVHTAHRRLTGPIVPAWATRLARPIQSLPGSS